MERGRRAVGPAYLTNRELQVVTLIVEGKLDKEIAKELSIEQSTVKSHLRGIKNKLGLRSKVQIAVWYVRNYS